MHVFCDESGGVDFANDIFLVSAVRIDPSDATRIMKTMRKAVKSSGELKGKVLTHEQRAIFFDMLAKVPTIMAVSVTCCRGHNTGRWAMNNVKEELLWLHLCVESCCSLPKTTTGPRAITLDGGRYKKTVLAQIKVQMSELVTSTQGRGVSISYGNSVVTDGLQVADIISNTVYQAIGRQDSEAKGLVMACRNMSIRHVELPGISPQWLKQTVMD